MQIDHVVLWVDDPKDALAFYTDVLGLAGVRADEFAAGQAPFPSVRLSDATILDLMDRQLVPFVREFTAGGESGGTPVNHVCFSMSKAEYDALTDRLRARDIALAPGGATSFGAQGVTPHSVYFRDPWGNVLEIRHYESAS